MSDDKKEQLMSRVLTNHVAYQSLSFEVSKPGYHRIVGRVKSTNDLNRLKQDLQRAGVRKIILLVEIEDQKSPMQ